jgi:hypothetical protein
MCVDNMSDIKHFFLTLKASQEILDKVSEYKYICTLKDFILNSKDGEVIYWLYEELMLSDVNTPLDLLTRLRSFKLEFVTSVKIAIGNFEKRCEEINLKRQLRDKDEAIARFLQINDDDDLKIECEQKLFDSSVDAANTTLALNVASLISIDEVIKLILHRLN